jgi:hypothetical protein
METYTVNGQEVESHDKDAFDDYRSNWTRDEDVTEVDEEGHVAPQYEQHFPAAGEYPDEVYEETGCIPVEEVRERLSIGDRVVFWTSPPCNENAYLTDSTVRGLPPVEFHRPGEPSFMSEDHITCHNGQALDELFGPVTWQVRVDCIVAINP